MPEYPQASRPAHNFISSLIVCPGQLIVISRPIKFLNTLVALERLIEVHGSNKLN